MATPILKMLPPSYQKVVRAHLSAQQYLTLELLILLMQSHRTLCLGQLANVFPQPIQYASRVRHLQRFLLLPSLSIKLLWFPLLKHGLKQARVRSPLNRHQRRRMGKQRRLLGQYCIVILDRTQWRAHNLLMVSLAWHQHALPLYWQFLPQLGNSCLRHQQQVLTPVLRLLKPYPIVVIADREFHSAKLANWLTAKGVEVISRQKKSAYVQLSNAEGQTLKQLGFHPGSATLLEQVRLNKRDPLGPFNLAVRWKRRYRSKGSKDPWYLLSTLSNLNQIVALYHQRWGIETMFRDCKSGGYQLEATWVNRTRLNALLLIMTLAYALATGLGQTLQASAAQPYLKRVDDANRTYPHRSVFWVGLSAYLWSMAMTTFAVWAQQLMALKPHKRLYFQRGLHALSLIHDAL